MIDKKKQGKTSRNKGHNAERYFAKEFRELGFEGCKTTRYASKMFDDLGIDLIYIPFNVQIKAGSQRGMIPSKVLEDVKERIRTKLPQIAVEHNYPTLLIHQRTTGKKETECLVTLTFKDFKKIITNEFNHNKTETD